MATTTERLRAVRVKIDEACELVRGDPGASPVLVAVVNEFANRAAAADHEREAVIELEQAGDSTKAAVDAVSDAARQAVLAAHLAICIAKAKL